MKNFILLLTLSTLTLFGKAQSVNVTAFGNPVSQGDVIEVEATVEGSGDFRVLTWNPELFASANAPETSATVIVTTDDADFTICWPRQCEGILPNIPMVKEGQLNTTPVDLEIHRMIMIYGTDPVSIPEGVATVTFKAAGQKDLTFSIKCLPYVENAQDNAVGEITSDTEVVAIYDLSGRRLSNRLPGVNIIVYSNGKTVKEITDHNIK